MPIVRFVQAAILLGLAGLEGFPQPKPSTESLTFLWRYIRVKSNVVGEKPRKQKLLSLGLSVSL